MPNSGNTPVSNGRAGQAEIDAQAKLLEAVPAVARILDAVPAMLMILNRQRQVVLANNSLARFAGAEDPEELRGLRSGEIFGCIHASHAPDGCGSTEACTACGALKAMQSALIGRASTQHSRLVCITDRHEAQLELEVSASPLEIAGQAFTLVYLVDASDRTRRHWFERAVIPQALGLSTELEILTATIANPASDDALRSGCSPMLLAASRRLTSLLREIPEMAEAEAGGYACATVRVAAAELLTAAAGQTANDAAALGRRILFEPWDEDLAVDTDPMLARRILEKILLNALEATPVGGTVTLGCRNVEAGVELWIHNSGAIPRHTQLQIFQRSFSTKGPGRGYGTYFVKLMTERCLGGAVSFRSEAGEGTTFVVRLPRSGRGQGAA
ncbi:MAG TPA: ATP-binding protein [Bryobacteraceae bacterium]